MVIIGAENLGQKSVMEDDECLGRKFKLFFAKKYFCSTDEQHEGAILVYMYRYRQ